MEVPEVVHPLAGLFNRWSSTLEAVGILRSVGMEHDAENESRDLKPLLTALRNAKELKHLTFNEILMVECKNIMREFLMEYDGKGLEFKMDRLGFSHLFAAFEDLVGDLKECKAVEKLVITHFWTSFGFGTFDATHPAFFLREAFPFFLFFPLIFITLSRDVLLDDTLNLTFIVFLSKTSTYIDIFPPNSLC